MEENRKKYFLLFFVLILIIIDGFILYFDWVDSKENLTFAMLDVGQGDSLFIESPTGTQILIDGGPPKKILNKLSLVMSPFDRHINGIVITNPDQDHMAGFLDLLKIYEVDYVFESGTYNTSKTFQNLKNEINQKNIPTILAKKGMKLDLGGGAYLDFLFPDRDVSLWERNDGSIVSKLIFGEFSVLLTGDATTKTESLLEKTKLDSDILKVGHHGSRTSSSLEFLKEVSPSISLISAGKDNNYGHPHKDVLSLLEFVGSKIFRTDEVGSIVIKSNGKEESFYFYK